MAWPKRMGLVTAHDLARLLKAILQKFYEKYPGRLTPEQIAKVDNLIDCCTEFLSDVPQYEPTD